MQIQPNERDKIAFYLAKKLSIRMIAKKLNRSPSSISDEIKRNSYHDIYSPIKAQSRADFRKRMARRRHYLKDKETANYVIDRLKLGWSPEQIDGRLKLEKVTELSLTNVSINTSMLIVIGVKSSGGFYL